MKKTILLSILCCILGVTVSGQDYWEIINTPPDIGIHSVAVNSNKDIFTGVAWTAGGGVMRKIDNGNIWDTSLCLINDVIGTIYIDKYDNIFAASRKLYYSDDNGVDWNQIFTSQLFGITSIFKNLDNFIFVGIWGGIYKSESIGSNWVQVLSLENTEVVNAIIEDTTIGVLYAGTINFIGGGGVYRSVDGGDTWKHIGLTDNYVSSLALNSSGDLFAGTRGQQYTYGGGVFVLPAGQTEWINLNDDELVTSIVINSEDKIYIGCSTLDFYWGGVRCSLDNGQTWEDISYENMYDEDIEELILGPEEHLYALAYNSATPLYKSVNSTTTSLPDNQNEDSIIIYNYPNPFSDKTTISYTLRKQSSVFIKVFDIYGKEVKFINENIKNTGQHKTELNAKDLPAGVYFYSLFINEKLSDTKKMIIVK